MPAGLTSLRACVSRQRAPSRSGGAGGSSTARERGGVAPADDATAEDGASPEVPKAVRWTAADSAAGGRRQSAQELQARVLQLLAPSARPRAGAADGGRGPLAGGKRKRARQPVEGLSAGALAGGSTAGGGGGGSSGGDGATAGAGLAEYARVLQQHLARAAGAAEPAGSSAAAASLASGAPPAPLPAGAGPAGVGGARGATTGRRGTGASDAAKAALQLQRADSVQSGMRYSGHVPRRRPPSKGG
jgi:hypothetical protein